LEGVGPSSTFLGPNAGFWIRIHFIQIRIQHFRLNTGTDPDPDLIRIQDLYDQNWKKFTAEKKLSCFGSKLQFTYPYASIKDVQVTKEAFSSEKRTSSTSKNEIS
jgi:hypothetical protein